MGNASSSSSSSHATTSSSSPPLPSIASAPASTNNAAAITTASQSITSSPPSPLVPPNPSPATVTSSYWLSYFSRNSGSKSTTNAASSASRSTQAVSSHSIAPPPAAIAALSTPAIPVSSSTPAPTRSLTSFLPILGGCTLVMAGGIAYGVRYGQKQSIKIEENFAEYEIKPSEIKEIEITPEMRRYALRRTMGAFTISTILCFSLAGAFTYGISQYWDVKSVPEVNEKLTTIVRGIRMPFESTATRWVDSFNVWIENSWIGRNWSEVGPHTPRTSEIQADPRQAAANQILAAQQEEDLRTMWNEAKRQQEDWNIKKQKEKEEKMQAKERS